MTSISTKWAAPGGLALLLSCAAPGEDPTTGSEFSPPDACLGSAVAAPSPEHFTDEALTRGAAGRIAHNRGVAAADFNGDGRTDLFVTESYDGSRLLLAGDDGGFTPYDAPSTGYDSSASAVDFDQDGDVDIWLGCGGFLESCPDRLLRNDGPDPTAGVRWVDVSRAAGIADLERATFGVAWADYDGDGDPDAHIAAKRPTDENDDWLPGPTDDLLWRNNGDGTFTEVSEEAGTADPADHHQAAWLDVDEDGDPDLFVPTLDGPNVLYRNDGDGSFTEDTPEALRAPRLAFAAVAEDFDSDGHPDLLVAGMAAFEGEHHHFFRGLGDGEFEDLSEPLGLSSPELRMRTMGLQVGDLDQDGYLEVAFGNGNPDRGDVNGLLSFRFDGAGDGQVIDRGDLIDRAAAGSDVGGYPYRSHGMAFFDAEGDGDTDLFVGNGGAWPDQAEPDQLFIHRPASGQGRALRLHLVDSRGRPAGLGSRVTVRSEAPGASWQVVRTVGRSSGFNSSRPHTLSVGIGHCEGPYRVEVQPPWGAPAVTLDRIEGSPTGVRHVEVLVDAGLGGPGP